MRNRWSVVSHLVLGACMLGLMCGACFCASDRKSVRFFRYDLLTIGPEMIVEGFDLGEVYAGDKIKIQLFVRNRTATRVTVRPARDFPTDIQLDRETVEIEPGDGVIVHASLTIPTSPKELNESYRLESKLTEDCRLVGVFKSKIRDVACFAVKELTYDFSDDDTRQGKIAISIPLLLSDIDLKKLRVRCSESKSFLSLATKSDGGKPKLLATFDPREMPSARYDCEILLENSDPVRSSAMKLTIVHKSDLEILPERIVLKRKPDSELLFGESVLRSRVGDISSINMSCAASTGDKVKCRLVRITDHLGRIYLELDPKSRVSGASEFQLLFKASQGNQENEIRSSIFIAN